VTAVVDQATAVVDQATAVVDCSSSGAVMRVQRHQPQLGDDCGIVLRVMSRTTSAKNAM
jgi:hypothetical protein